MKPRPWTTGEQLRLRQLRAAGESIPRCAAALDRSRGSVSGALVRMGLVTCWPGSRRKPGELQVAVLRLRSRGKGASESARILGVARCTVNDTLAALGVR